MDEPKPAKILIVAKYIQWIGIQLNAFEITQIAAATINVILLPNLIFNGVNTKVAHIEPTTTDVDRIDMII